MKETKPILSGEVDNIKIDQFIKYFQKTWISENCNFDRSVWNFFKQYSRTNNLNETYNHKVNGQVILAHSHIYKILDLLQKQETLTANKFMRVNLGAEKR